MPVPPTVKTMGFHRQDFYEWKYLMDNQTAGVESGYFDVIAHPDRLFKREKQWTEDMRQASERFIFKAVEHSLPLEKNLSSIRRKRQYWDEFWNLVPKSANIVVGCDAHAVDEIVPWWNSEDCVAPEIRKKRLTAISG